MCTLARTKFAAYPEYHTSLDILDFISEEGLNGGFEMIRRCIDLLEINEKYIVTTAWEEGALPQYKHKVQRGGGQNPYEHIAYADGKNDLIDIAERIGVDALSLKENVKKLLENKLFAVIKN